MMKIILLFNLCFIAMVFADEKISFSFEVRPILSDKCFHCHGPDNKNRKANLRLDIAEGAFKAIKGRLPIVPGNLSKSSVWQRINTTDEDEIMPPPETHLKLTNVEKEVIKKWIEQGATYSGHWAFQPLAKKITVPLETKSSGNAIDAFVNKKLQQAGLSMNETARKEILLRRVTFVLTGLPPTVADVQNFLADKRVDAYERVVDRLLASKASAEKLAVDWMDLSRFADSYGFQVDHARDTTVWRDWVLSTFDKNMPYDQFITWQLAGDLISNPTQDSILATAFNRQHQQESEGGSIPEEYRVEYVADRTHTVGTAFMGLTFECARCHDHKFDPISMKDYYRLFAFFNNIDEAGLYPYFTKSVPTPSLLLTNAQSEATMAAQKAQIVKLETELKSMRELLGDAFMEWLATSPKVEIKDLIGEFNFDSANDGLKNKVATDAKGQGNAMFVEDEGRKAFKLSGDNELTFDNLGELKRSEAFSVHLKMKAPKAEERAVVIHRTKAWTDAASRGWELLIEEGKLSWALINFYPGNAIKVTTKEKIPLNQWLNVTVTYDGSSRASGLKIYLDDKLQEIVVVRDSLTKEIHYGNPKQAVIIGARMRDRGFTNGFIDHFNYFQRELSLIEIKQLLNLPYSTSSTPQEYYDYYLTTVDKNYIQKNKELKEAREQLNKTMESLREVMVMAELKERRRTFVLSRGLYDSPDLKQEVEPAPPEEIFLFPKDLPRNRLGLAQWLTSPQQPLTSRVAVNRYWQMIFGVGLVATPDDFGSQGALPTHPELLDWLAREFIVSGWNIKGLLKTMVMSQSFKQSSVPTAEKLAQDPLNKLFSFGVRRRLSAEMMRDTVLFSSGLLKDEFGGGSVNGDNNFKRSLYIFWKRTEPPADMTIFDAPTRQLCTVKRERTSTPLQALVLLNKQLYTQTAAVLANRVLNQYQGQEKAILREIFMSLTAREPEAFEEQILLELVKSQIAHFTQQKVEAENYLKNVNLTKPWQNKNELVAWSVVVNAIINLDSTVILR